MKTIGTMLCLASLLLLAACTAGPEEAAGTQDTTLPGAAVATCRVVDVQDGQLILAAADGGGERRLCPRPGGPPRDL